MNKATILSILTMLLTCATLHAHNGEIYYATKSKSTIKVDGELKDWASDVRIAPMYLYSKKEHPDKKDLSASFRVTHNSEKLYVAVELFDDYFISSKKETSDWYEEDLYILYLNINHALSNPTAVRMFFTERGVELEKLDEKFDPVHQFLDASMVDYKMNTSEKGKRTYEISIELPEEYFNSTIGIDHQIIDVDKDDRKDVLYWGKSMGRYLDSKLFNPGYLGDLFLMENLPAEMMDIKGKVSWDKPVKGATKVKISNVENPKYWTLIETDTLGQFSVNLPKGDYLCSPGEVVSSSFTSDGFNNQFRIKAEASTVLVKADDAKKQNIDLKITTYSEPDFLIPEKGILLDFNKNDVSDIDNFVETYRKYYDVSAVSLGIIHDNKLVHHNTYGSINTINYLPFEDNTMFQAASITKSVFAYIVMRLYDRGEIDLDKPIYEVMPFENLAHNDGYKIITPRIILSHQTGLDNWPLGGPNGWQRNDSKIDFNYYPGTDFSYSGEAYQWLSRYVQKITGKDMYQLLEDEVKTPLGIKNMHLSGNKDIHQPIGQYGGTPNLWGMTRQAGVAHSLMTEAQDFSKFVVELGAQTQISKKVYEEFFKPTRESNGYPLAENSPYRDRRMGLGFYVMDTDYGKVIVHGGNNGDYQCIFKYFIDKKMGFVIFTNTNTGHKIWQGLEELLIFGKKSM